MFYRYPLKRIVIFIVLIGLVFAIPLTVFIAQKQQETRQRASGRDWQFPRDFSTTQGANNLSYLGQFDTDANPVPLLVNTGTSYWYYPISSQHPQGSIDRNFMITPINMSPGYNIRPTIRWTAPENGTITITGSFNRCCHDTTNPASPYTKFFIYKNSTELNHVDYNNETINPITNSSGQPLTLSVNQNDTIDFTLDPANGDSGWDSTSLNFTIQYPAVPTDIPTSTPFPPTSTPIVVPTAIPTVPNTPIPPTAIIIPTATPEAAQDCLLEHRICNGNIHDFVATNGVKPDESKWITGNDFGGNNPQISVDSTKLVIIQEDTSHIEFGLDGATWGTKLIIDSQTITPGFVWRFQVLDGKIDREWLEKDMQAKLNSGHYKVGLSLKRSSNSLYSTVLPRQNVTPTPTVRLAADVDGNGCIGIGDYGAWLYARRNGGTPRSAQDRPDIDGVNGVTIVDYALWLSARRSGQNICP